MSQQPNTNTYVEHLRHNNGAKKNYVLVFEFMHSQIAKEVGIKEEGRKIQKETYAYVGRKIVKLFVLIQDE